MCEAKAVPISSQLLLGPPSQYAVQLSYGLCERYLGRPALVMPEHGSYVRGNCGPQGGFGAVYASHKHSWAWELWQLLELVSSYRHARSDQHGPVSLQGNSQ